MFTLYFERSSRRSDDCASATEMLHNCARTLHAEVQTIVLFLQRYRTLRFCIGVVSQKDWWAINSMS
jgi:deoxycytidylate deaminase